MTLTVHQAAKVAALGERARCTFSESERPREDHYLFAVAAADAMAVGRRGACLVYCHVHVAGMQPLPLELVVTPGGDCRNEDELAAAEYMAAEGVPA